MRWNAIGRSGRNSRMAGHSSSHFTDRGGYPAFRVSKPVVSLVIAKSRPRAIYPSLSLIIYRVGKVEDGLIDWASRLEKNEKGISIGVRQSSFGERHPWILSNFFSPMTWRYLGFFWGGIGVRRVLEETVLCFGFKIIFGEEWKFVVSLIICETKMRNGIICVFVEFCTRYFLVYFFPLLITFSIKRRIYWREYY